MTYDPLQRFTQLVPGGNGIIYGVQADGNLMWFRHTGWQNGAVTWANSGAGVAIGSGWNQFATVLADQTGQLFGITAAGDVRWYKYNCTNLNTGAGSWAGGGAGPVVGSGFTYPHIFGGFDGVLYCIDATGNLWWYQYTAGNGQPGWANAGSGRQIGAGFQKLRRAWAEPSGVIYGVEENDDNLGWYRYLGSGTWANGGSVVTIGSGWGDGTQKTEFANGSGVIYTVSVDDDQVNGNDWNLNWYKLNNSQTVTPASGGRVGDRRWHDPDRKRVQRRGHRCAAGLRSHPEHPSRRYAVHRCVHHVPDVYWIRCPGRARLGKPGTGDRARHPHGRPAGAAIRIPPERVRLADVDVVHRPVPVRYLRGRADIAGGHNVLRDVRCHPGLAIGAARVRHAAEHLPCLQHVGRA